MLAHYMTAGVDYVREDHGRATKYVVFERDPLIYRDIILNLHSVANPDTRTNDDVLTEITIGSDP